jgi:hypothetical protein
MALKIETVINYCTNEYRFIHRSVSSVVGVSAQVLIPVADHFFDGTPEDSELLVRTRRENLGATLIPYAWTPGHSPRYWLCPRQSALWPPSSPP